MSECFVISKKEFVKACANIATMTKQLLKVCDALQCDFSAGFEWLDNYMNLLISIFKNYGFDEDVEYFIYDLDCGEKYYEGCFRVDNKNIDISTPEKFYDYMVDHKSYVYGTKEVKLPD